MSRKSAAGISRTRILRSRFRRVSISAIASPLLDEDAMDQRVMSIHTTVASRTGDDPYCNPKIACSSFQLCQRELSLRTQFGGCVRSRTELEAADLIVVEALPSSISRYLPVQIRHRDVGRTPPVNRRRDTGSTDATNQFLHHPYDIRFRSLFGTCPNSHLRNGRHPIASAALRNNDGRS